MDECRLENASGMTIVVQSRGATLQQIVVDGINVLRPAHFGGSICGRYANRIGGSAFVLDGKSYNLSPGPNGAAHLHGGNVGFDKCIWNLELKPHSIRCSLTSPNGDEGYPGTMNIVVIYSLAPYDNVLRIEYQAHTSQPTVVNLTSHCYFNLNSDDSDISNHIIEVFADRFTPIDAELIPTGNLALVEGLMDLRTPKRLGECLWLDHNFVLKSQFAGRLVANNRIMRVFTSEPGLQIYAGAKVGVCFETQHFPDSPNKPQFPSTVLMPGDTFSSWTEYHFGRVSDVTFDLLPFDLIRSISLLLTFGEIKSLRETCRAARKAVPWEFALSNHPISPSTRAQSREWTIYEGEDKSGMYRIALSCGRVVVWMYQEFGCGQGGSWKEYSGIVLAGSSCQHFTCRLLTVRTISQTYGGNSRLTPKENALIWNVRREILSSPRELHVSISASLLAVYGIDSMFHRCRTGERDKQLVPHSFPSNRFDWAFWSILIKFFDT